MLKREILLTGCAIVLALSGQEAKAAEACMATPTCAELGYSKTSCGSAVALKCPFDKTKMFCAPQTYEAGDVIKLNGTSIGVAVNSNLAVAMTDEGIMTWDNAVAKCKAKTTGGKSWRLPTVDELNRMYNEKELLDSYFAANEGMKFQHGAYWSSAEYASTNAWYVNMGNGGTGYGYKTYTYNVRCVFDF